MIRLGELFPHAAMAPASAAREITSIACDSRAITRGAVFFAVPGARADGLAFVPDAVERGAVAIVAEHAPTAPIGEAAFIQVADVRGTLAEACARLYPGQPETIVAITGTSGKTSVAAFVRQIWSRQGAKAASLGTLGVVSPTGSHYGSLTTPDPVTLHKTLDELARAGVTRLVVEASSHGLDQKRLDGLKVTAGAFTNLSRDHLDYHVTLEAYFDAKMRLFEHLLAPGRPAVVDADSDVAAKVVAICEKRGLAVTTTGFAGSGLRLLEADTDDFSSRLRVLHAGAEHLVRLPLVGVFQASNALVAAGLCIVTGSPPDEVFSALEKLEGAPGRLELVGRRNGAPIFVDYAHKPDALEKALLALRPFVRGRLGVVFGCGGDRDKGKRPIMGEIAAKLADFGFVTDDNPRSEDPAMIRAEVLAGADGSGRLREIGDRAAAIYAAIEALGSGDGLLIAGKGHETGQIIGTTIVPFSDSDCARAALKDLAI